MPVSRDGWTSVRPDARIRCWVRQKSVWEAMAYWDVQIIYGRPISGQHVDQCGLRSVVQGLFRNDAPVPAELRDFIHANVSDRDNERGHGCALLIGAHLGYLEDSEVGITGVTPMEALRLVPTADERIAVASVLSLLPEELLSCPHLLPLGVYFVRHDDSYFPRGDC